MFLVEQLELGEVNQLIIEVAAQAARSIVFGVAQKWALKATEIPGREHSKKGCLHFVCITFFGLFRNVSISRMANCVHMLKCK